LAASQKNEAGEGNQAFTRLRMRHRHGRWRCRGLCQGAQLPLRHRSPVGQSQFVEHTVAVGGRQYPMRHSVPVAQVVPALH
jgi:hypothetical protein